MAAQARVAPKVQIGFASAGRKCLLELKKLNIRGATS
jgi:hypothetical protein